MESYEVLGVFGACFGSIRRCLLSRHTQDGSTEISLQKTSLPIWNTLASSGEIFLSNFYFNTLLTEVFKVISIIPNS